MILLPLLKYAYELKYDEEPNYSQLKFLLTKILLDKGHSLKIIFDWSPIVEE